MTIIRTPSATYEPWTDGYAVGFKVSLADGTVQYIYLNPSIEEENDAPNVFLYQGPDGNPMADSVHHEHFPIG